MSKVQQDDLERVIAQEAALRLPRFDNNDAWKLGTLVRGLALERGQTLVIDVRRFGHPSQQLFFSALAGTIPDNARWVERKANVVARFHRSSYQLGLYLAKSGVGFSEKYSLPDAEYACHGGGFPIHVTGVGVVGALTVSGLPQRQDHNLCVEALCLTLGVAPETMLLP